MFKKIIFLFAFFVSAISFSCSTTANINEYIKSNTQAITRLENTVNNLDAITGRSTERINAITEKSREITDGIDQLEFLFREYESEINRLLNEINDLRNEIKE